MKETHEIFKLGVNTNNIERCGQPPQSHRHFKRSTEGIAPQQKNLIIVNETSSLRNYMKTVSENSNNLVLVNTNTPDSI